MKKKIIITSIVTFIIYTIFNYNLPVYSYESSDRKMAEIEVPWKGRTLIMVKENFENYKKFKDDSELKLFRTCKRTWNYPNLWFDNIFNERWEIPYMKPSSLPNYDYYGEMKKDNN